MKSAANEYRRLTDGVGGRVKETRTIRFIKKQDLPKDRQKDVTYDQLVCTEQNKKDKKLRSRSVFGGNQINYIGKVTTPTNAGMMVAKQKFN